MNTIDQLMASSNCIGQFGITCPSTYCPPQPVVYSPKELKLEAVDGGYIISGYNGKAGFRTVALDAQGLAAIVKNWAKQFEAKAA